MNIRQRLSFVLLIMAVSASHAQTSPTLHVSIQQVPMSAEVPNDWLSQVVATFDQSKLHAVALDSWELRLVDTDKKLAPRILRRGLGAVAGLYTLTVEGADVLVARLNDPNASNPEEAIWLWDTPSATAFVIQVNPAVLNSRLFTEYCESLLRWDEEPVKLTALRLYYPLSAGAEQRVVGRGVHAEQESGMFSWWLEGASIQGRAYVAIGTSKSFFTYPPEALIPERFPPFRDRLKSMSRPTIFGELGKGYRPPYMATYPSRRDSFLLAELLSRGPVDDVEIHQLVIGPFDQRDDWRVVNSRLLSFLDIVQQRNELASYSSALERLCQLAKRDGGLQEVAVRALFGAMARNQIDFSRAALSLVERDQFTEAGLYYLGRNARDERTLRALSDLAVTANMTRNKQDALRQIKERIQAHPRF